MSDPASPPSAGPFAPEDHPRRLNLGCGFDRRDGYLNVDLNDFHDPDLVADVRDLSMLPAGGYDEILAFDVLEHLPRSDTDTCLAEWHRLLRPGGALTLQLPDLLACARQLLERDSVADHQQLVHQLWGTQAYTGDFHLAAFTDLMVVDALHRAGFHRTHLETIDGWMFKVATEKVGGDEPRQPVATGYVSGFYELEGEPPHVWRWSTGDAVILLANAADEPVTVALAATLDLPGARKAAVTVTAGEHCEEVRIGRSPVAWQRRLTIAPGPTRVHVRSHARPVEAPGDDRTLVVQVGNPTITVIS